jgi:two-component system, sensor histidine kinase
MNKKTEPQISQISRDRAFDLRIVFKQIYFSCITGAVGLLYGLIVTLTYVKHVDRTFYFEIVGWSLFGMTNISWRSYLFFKWRKQSTLDLYDVQKRRWQAALLAGALWGTAGILFFDNLNATGQSLLLLAFVIMNFTGIPTLYASTLGFSLLWGATWLPLLFFKHNNLPQIIVLVYSTVVIVSGLFISYALRKAIKDLFFTNEAYSEKVVSLDQDNQQLKMFFLAANHDLSQPIAAIQHSIYALTKQTKEPELVAAPLEIMRTSTASLSRLIEDIIHFEKITSGLSKAELIAVNLNDLFKRVIARCDHLAKAKDIGLWARPTNRWVNTDAYILERILGNLVENALRYTADGSVIVAARPCGDYVSIEVWDTGLGMSREDIEHIFEIFYRREATKTMHKGYGLGLSIVKRLADSIDGIISVRSAPGKGSVFKLRLPVTVMETSPNLATDN